MHEGTATVPGGYSPDDIEVRASRDDLHLLELHDILQLSAQFASFAEELGMKEMPDTPIVTIPMYSALVLWVSP